MASPCAACKFLRRKCTNGCVFAPYFPPDQPAKFASVHKIFGASNVSKLLNDLPQHQREEAVNALSYEATARINDPVYGCVANISILQNKIKETQRLLELAKEELSSYTGSAAYPSFHPQPHLLTQNHSSAAMPATYMAGPYGLTNLGIGIDLGLGTSAAMPPHSGVLYRDQAEVQQHLLAVETFKEQNRIRFNAAMEGMRGSYNGHFNTNLAASMLGAVELVSPQAAQVQHQCQNIQPPVQQQVSFDNVFLARPVLQQQQQQVHLQTQQQTKPQLQPEMQFFSNQLKQQQQHRRVGSDEGRSCIRPNSLP